eukprot:c18198_g4_i1 orf=1-186(-)
MCFHLSFVLFLAMNCIATSQQTKMDSSSYIFMLYQQTCKFHFVKLLLKLQTVDIVLILSIFS